MIVSHSSKFILLSINKIATTTSHAVLDQFVKDDDISTGYHDETDDEFIIDEKSQGRNVPEVTYNEFIKNLEVSVPTMPEYVGGPIKEPNPKLQALLKMYPEEAMLNNIAKATFKHSTPTEMVRWSIINETHLDEYKIYAFIRNPIQRALSSYFFEQYVHKLTPAIEDIVTWIDSLDERGPSVFLNKKYKNYFEYNGRRITQPLKFENYNEEIAKIVDFHNGTMSATIPTFKSKCRPDWSKADVNTWLPIPALKKLKSVLEEDIEFYNIV